MTSVSIITGSRLHFGPLSVAAPAGGRFGGVGVMIASPGFELTAHVATRDAIDADQDVASRVERFLRTIRRARVPAVDSACAISVTRSIPAHCGFGSGTQLGLAIAHVESILSEEPMPALETLARRVGRGLRSAIGLHGFHRGGFLVDGGRSDTTRLGTLVTRVDFPEDWRFLLAIPQRAIGLSGAAEQTAFAQQSSMPLTLTESLCRIVLMDWLPAVINADFDQCSASLYEFGSLVGEFFSSVQGGVFAHPLMTEWATTLRQRGVMGVAQTSWGPTLAALCPDDAAAEQLRRDLVTDDRWRGCDFQVVSPLNRGATAVIQRDRGDDR